MNDKFGRDERYRGERYRDNRDDRYSEDHFGQDRYFRSPDQQFETSAPYRQPYGDGWSRDARYPARPGYGYGYDYGRAGYGHEANGHRNLDHQGFAPSAYVPEQPGGGFAGRGPKGYIRTDERIKEDVCERLSWNDEVDATDISVRVEGGEVTLEGRVATRHMKRLATDLVEDVPGVVDVHNTVRVTKPILSELKEKLTGQGREEHYANTGTKTTGAHS